MLQQQRCCVVLAILIFACLASSVQALSCGPRPKQGKQECEQVYGSQCWAEQSVVLKWRTQGCKKNNKLVYDGGCQCDGYCGYTCKAACQQDSQCEWVSGSCRNILTGDQGPIHQPSERCPLSTGSPTVPPSNVPTASPQKRTKSPTNMPTKKPTTIAPTRAPVCTRDSAFPSLGTESEDADYAFQSRAVSRDGKTVVVVRRQFLFDDMSSVNDEVFVVSQEGSNWIPESIMNVPNNVADLAVSLSAAGNRLTVCQAGQTHIYYKNPAESANNWRKHNQVLHDNTNLSNDVNCRSQISANGKFIVVGRVYGANYLYHENAKGIWVKKVPNSILTVFSAQSELPIAISADASRLVQPVLRNVKSTLAIGVEFRKLVKKGYKMVNAAAVWDSQSVAVQPSDIRISADGKTVVVGGNARTGNDEIDFVSGSERYNHGFYIFTRAKNGKFVQQGKEHGGEFHGRFVDVNANGQSIVVSDGNGGIPRFELYRKSGKNWVSVGSGVLDDIDEPTSQEFPPIISRNGQTVLIGERNSIVWQCRSA